MLNEMNQNQNRQADRYLFPDKEIKGIIKK